MALSPESRAALQAAADETPVHAPGFDIAADRERSRALAAAEPKEPVAVVRDVDAGGVRCRLYVPAGHPGPEDGGSIQTTQTTQGTGGIVVYLHGGGFVLHDIDVHDGPARRLSNRSGLAVLSVDYRRPPEHRFPAAPDDVDTVLDWLGAHAGHEGLRGPVFVHGDSAGANLALVAALRHPGRLAAVSLVYPFLDPEPAYDSYRTEAHGMDAAVAAWYWQQYAATDADLRDPDLAPLRSDRLHTLPPTLVVTAEHDPLRDEGERLAAVLAELGVDVVGTRYLGLIHGFWRQAACFPQAEALTRQVAGFLRGHL